MRPLLHGAALLGAVLCGTAMAQNAAPLQMFRVIGPRDEVSIGLTAAELNVLEPGQAVERLARKLAADGQLSAWLYVVGRAPDGTTRFAPAGRVAIMRSDALRIESYRPALPVIDPPEPR